MKILDFQRHTVNIRNSLIHLRKLLLYFLIHLKSACNICRIFMEHSVNISIFNIPRTLFWEYSPEFHRERFPNILGIHHENVPQIFHKHVFAWCVVLKYLYLQRILSLDLSKTRFFKILSFHSFWKK